MDPMKEYKNAAGTDTRPPMLVESDYDSWKIRIHSCPHRGERKIDSEYSEEENSKLEMADTMLNHFLVKVSRTHLQQPIKQSMQRRFGKCGDLLIER
ncbi:hypothetical protein Tco_0638259 [Tanacetum coccineum]